MIRRVFLSHTSEFMTYPREKSFVDAAISAVNRANCIPCDMEYFTARDHQPAQYCIDRVRACDVYVGIIGLRYGSPVRDRPEVSYTELEFEAASRAPAKIRLVFLLDPDTPVPPSQFTDPQYNNRQLAFRKRLSDAEILCRSFTNFHELDKLIYQALVEEFPVSSGTSRKPERIEWPEDKSPYPGLEWFDDDYAPLFFGRDREVNELVGKLSEPGGRFLLVSGPSGSGKSSLVAAGLWKALVKNGRLKGSQSWRWLRITPGADSRGPFVSLGGGLHHAFPKVTARVNDLPRILSNDPTAFSKHFTTQLSHGPELVLFVDQLEELFTQSFPQSEIQSFLSWLVTNCNDVQSRLRVVATIRSEFFGRLAESEDVRLKINEGFHVLVGPMSLMALHDMIQKPAEMTGYTFERGLVDVIAEDAGKEPGNLPLVAYALKQLFEESDGRTFTRAVYDAMGGIVGAIGSKADQVMETIGQKASASFDRVFAELVHVDRHRPPTRKRVSLAHFTGDEEAVKVIQMLAGQDCRVLVTAGEWQGATVEVAHEKLFSSWSKLKDWIDTSGDVLREIDHADEEGRSWQQGGDNPQELWLGSRAKKVLTAIERFGKWPSPELQRFLRPQAVLIARLDKIECSHQERLLIGQKLADFGDTRPGIGVKDGLPDIAWVDIPGGSIKLEGVDHVFEVKPFHIAKYLVTNGQFGAFLKAEDGYRNEEWWKGIVHDDVAQSSWMEANSPREKVSWYDAVAFCRWLSARTGTSVRLPTEWEWQQVATGGDPRRWYPWEGEWDPLRCNSNESRLNRTTAVGMYPQGATQQGVLDIAGNLWEWCQNTYQNPERPEAVRIDNRVGQCVMRGGSWNPTPEDLRTSFRDRAVHDYRGLNIGFRLVRILGPTPFPVVF